jgi:tetratricopeptide (TPR) repeat protein
MLKKLLPVLCFLLLFSAAKAQRSKAVAFYKAGINYKLTNNFAEALTAFTKAVSFDKKFDSAYVEMGNIYSGSGKIDMGIYNYNKALEINPNYTTALFGMGKNYRDAKQDLDSAIFFFIAAEKTDKTNKEIYYGLAWIYNAKKDYERAIPYAIRSLEIDNTYKPAYGELGHAYRASKKFTEAIEQFKKNLAVSVVDVALLYSGYCYTELKNKEGAMQQYEALMKINEKMAGALKNKIDAMPAN